MIIKYLKNRHIKYISTSTDDNIRICCPNCIDDNFHAYIHLKKGLGRCNKCDFSFNYQKLIAAYENITYKDAKAILEDLGYRANTETYDSFRKSIEDKLNPEKIIEEPFKLKECKYPDNFILLKDSNSYLAKQAKNYLYGRKVTNLYDFGYCYPDKKYENRIILPCKMQNKLVFFSGRSWTNSKLKTLFPNKEEAPNGKADSLFRYDINKDKKLIALVEGEFDALRLYDKAIGIYGKFLSENQFNLLRELQVELVLMLDKDAKKEQINLYRKLYSRIELSMVFLNTKDPGETDKEVLEELIKNRIAPNLTQLLLYNL